MSHKVAAIDRNTAQAQQVGQDVHSYTLSRACVMPSKADPALLRLGLGLESSGLGLDLDLEY